MNRLPLPLPRILALILLTASTAAGCAAQADAPIGTHDDPSGGAAPYSRSVQLGDTIYLAGVLGTKDGKLVEGGVAAQTRAAFAQIEAGLAARGRGLKDLVKCTVFLADIGDFGAMNDAYKSVLPAPRPARTTVGAALVFGAAIEVDCIASAQP